MYDLNYYLERIKNKQYFSFCRYGDGEWNCIQGIKGANCDHHEYFPEMGKDLLKSIHTAKQFSPADYFIGIQNLAKRVNADIINSTFEDLPWLSSYCDPHNSDVFHEASARGELPNILNALNTIPVVIIGPKRLRNLSKYIPYVNFIEVPLVNCYLDKKRILEELKACPTKGVYSFSSSMLTEPLIAELYLLKPESFLIDFGSVWDILINEHTRSYHRTMSEDIKNKNKSV